MPVRDRAVPRVIPMAASLPFWRRLHLVADAAYDALLTLWHAVLARYQQGLSQRRLRRARTEADLLGSEALWRVQWQREVQAPIRDALPSLVAAGVTRGALLQWEAFGSLEANVPPYAHDVSETALAVRQYVGQQERLLWQTTLLGLRAASHAARDAGLSEPQHAAWLHAVAGLTPGQVGMLTRHDAQRQQEGQSWRDRLAALERLAEQARLQRAQTIAATESMASVHLGTQAALQQVLRRGLLGLVTLRRYWRVTPDERLCQRCLAIAATHAAGVGLTEPFQTAEGALMTPPRHARCRCVVEVRRG